MNLKAMAKLAASDCCGDKLCGCCVEEAVEVMAAKLAHVRAMAACNATAFEITQYIAGLGIQSE